MLVNKVDHYLAITIHTNLPYLASPLENPLMPTQMMKYLWRVSMKSIH